MFRGWATNFYGTSLPAGLGGEVGCGAEARSLIGRGKGVGGMWAEARAIILPSAGGVREACHCSIRPGYVLY